MLEIKSIRGAYIVDEFLYIKREDGIESPFTGKFLSTEKKLTGEVIKKDIEENKGKEMLPLWYCYFDANSYRHITYKNFLKSIKKFANYGYSNTLIKVQDVL